MTRNEGVPVDGRIGANAESRSRQAERRDGEQHPGASSYGGQGTADARREPPDARAHFDDLSTRGDDTSRMAPRSPEGTGRTWSMSCASKRVP
jgi:hypothetical protein